MSKITTLKNKIKLKQHSNTKKEQGLKKSTLTSILNFSKSFITKSSECLNPEQAEWVLN